MMQPRLSLPPSFVAVGVGRNRGAVGLLVADRRNQDHARRIIGIRRARHPGADRGPGRRKASPYSGRIEFVEPEGGGVSTAGRAEKGRTTTLRASARHRDEIRSETNKRTGCSRPTTTPPAALRRTAAVPAQRHDGEQGKRALRDRQGGAKRNDRGLLSLSPNHFCCWVC